jgi:hypothetical protein
VVSFGDAQSAEVATLGLNPSKKEFLNAAGGLLRGEQRRLATLESINAQRLDRLDDDQVARVVADCGDYFHRNPYNMWFNPLDEILRNALGASYKDGTACHLDLVQWATDPVWAGIPDPKVRQALLMEGVRHLHAQLEHSRVRLVLINGQGVIAQLKAQPFGSLSLEEVGTLPMGHTTCTLVRGADAGITFLGWSTNLQSSFGVSKAFRATLAARAADHLADVLIDARNAPDRSVVYKNPDGYLPSGLVLDAGHELFQALSAWLAGSERGTIGDVADYGGRPHVRIRLHGLDAVLNADTTRSAVRDYLGLVDRRGPDLAWRVVANKRGRINKVLPVSAGETLPGWYCYLVTPLDTPRVL